MVHRATAAQRLLVVAVLLLAARSGLADGPGQVGLTPSELAWLRAHPVIRLAPDPSFEPIEFIDREGRYRGATPDILRIVERRLGISFTLVPTRDWNDTLDRLRRGEVDVVPSIGASAERERFALFTRTVLRLPIGIFVREGTRGVAGLGDLTGLKVAVVAGYLTESRLRESHRGVQLAPVPDSLSGVMRVSMGEVDAFVDYLASASHYSQAAGISNLRLAGLADFTVDLAMAVPRDRPELRAILDKCIVTLTEGEIREISDRWLSLRAMHWRPSRLLVLSALASAFAALLVLAMGWNWSLRRTVAGRTAALETMAAQLEARVAERTAELTEEVAVRQSSELAALASEARLRDSEALYHSLVESLPQSVFRKDAEGRLVFANSSLLRLLGKGADEVLGRTDGDLHPPELAAKYQADDRAVLAGEVIASVEEHQLPDGRRLTVEVTKWPVRDADGRIVGLQGIFTDVTERVELEAQFRQAQKLESIGRLAGGVAHDLNNLLLPIMGYTEVVMESLGPDHPQAEDLREVHNAAERASALTRQLLAFSRKQVLDMQPVDLVAVVANFQRLLRRTISDDVVIAVRPSRQPAMVRADVGQIEQVLMNLVVNAQDAMPDGGAITIAVDVCPATEEMPLGAAEITVADTGTGMDADTLGHIFEPFFTTKQPGQGTGLGLATVYGIVRQHAGLITCDSRPGQGSRFTVRLPITDETTSTTTAAPLRDRRAGDATIAVVDDDDGARGYIVRVLRRRGYEVIEASGGVALIERLSQRERPVDLLLTDVVMPRMNGRELSGALRERWPGLKVLFISGYPEEVLSRRGVLEPGLHLLAKPFSGDDLCAAVRETLESDR